MAKNSAKAGLFREKRDGIKKLFAGLTGDGKCDLPLPPFPSTFLHEGRDLVGKYGMV